MSLTNFAKAIIGKLGYKITKLQNHTLYDSEEPFEGIRSLMSEQDRRGVFFDVGANIGQTIEELEIYFPEGRIYAFEPGSAFSILKKDHGGKFSVTLENIALGSKNEQKTFFVNSQSDMSSFLPLGREGWGQVIKEPIIEVKTLDSYCREKGIKTINLLKSDTQGFELELLKGSKESLQNIQFIFLEINFKEIYKGLPSFSDIYNFLSATGFKLVRFYRQQYSNNLLSHADVLFYNPGFKKN